MGSVTQGDDHGGGDATILIHRFPRLSPEEEEADERKQKRVAELDAAIFRALADRREAKIEMGRAFNEQKAILGHGKWQQHFEEIFASSGIDLRTAERYMKRARKEDAKAKIDKLSFLNSGSDDGATDVKTTTQKAKAAVDSQLGQKKIQKRTDMYRLPLPLISGDRMAVDALRQSAAWPDAEKSIILELRRLCAEHGVETRMNQEEEHESNSADT